MAVLVRDEKGLSALEMALLLPLFVLIIMGGFEIWKLMMLKRALYIGTYQAARYLASNDRFRDSETDLARQFIENELQGSGLYSSQMSLASTNVTLGQLCRLQSGFDYNCGWRPVTVEAELVVPVEIPSFFERRSQGLRLLRLKGRCYDNPCRTCEK